MRLFCAGSLLADKTEDTYPALLNSFAFDSASPGLWWTAEHFEFVDDRLPEETWHSQIWSLRIDSSTVRLGYLIAPSFVPTPLEIVEILRIDLQHDDDNVQVHFSPGDYL